MMNGRSADLWIQRFRPGVDESGPKPYCGPVFCEKKRFPENAA